jgi:hypothetical protein
MIDAPTTAAAEGSVTCPRIVPVPACTAVGAAVCAHVALEQKNMSAIITAINDENKKTGAFIPSPERLRIGELIMIY